MIPGLMRKHSERIYRGKNHFRLNKFAAFFGSNGSGKSNFVKALMAMRDIVGVGVNASKVQAFRYDEANNNTEFEVELYLGSKLFSYGFTCNLKNKTIVDEWLAEVKINEDEYLFKREKGKKIWISDKFFVNDKLKSRLSVYKDEVDESKNLLFLTKVVQSTLNSEFKKELSAFYEVYFFFVRKLNITTPLNLVSVNGVDLAENNNLKRLGELLHKFDTGITDVTKTEVSEAKFKEEVPAELYEEVTSKLQNDSTIKGLTIRSHSDFWVLKKAKDKNIIYSKVQFIHFGQVDKPFDLKDEADGTKRLFTLLDILMWNNDDTTFVVDELDRCLHPCLTRAFVNEFLKLAGASNYKNQLIISTHESRLMNLKYLRRDEIWFANNEGLKGSKIYPFDQFNERYDKVIDEAYLSGRFGAVPDFEALNDEVHR